MTETHLPREIAKPPNRICALLKQNAMRERSGHPANYLRYARKTCQSIPGGSFGPSIVLVHDGPLQPLQPVCVGISQPGRYPDIMAMTRAKALAARNLQAASLATQADFSLSLKHKPQRSVAATKSFLTHVVAALAGLHGLQQNPPRHLRTVTGTR
jgi:glucosamine--fructose-6-phosphate aminotransferase (isomerizing)